MKKDDENKHFHLKKEINIKLCPIEHVSSTVQGATESEVDEIIAEEPVATTTEKTFPKEYTNKTSEYDVIEQNIKEFITLLEVGSNINLRESILKVMLGINIFLCISVMVIIFLQGFQIMHLSENLLKILATTIIGEFVIGLIIIIKYFFPSNK
jgi:hypothetical protein